MSYSQNFLSSHTRKALPLSEEVSGSGSFDVSFLIPRFRYRLPHQYTKYAVSFPVTRKEPFRTGSDAFSSKQNVGAEGGVRRAGCRGVMRRGRLYGARGAECGVSEGDCAVLQDSASENASDFTSLSDAVADHPAFGQKVGQKLIAKSDAVTDQSPFFQIVRQKMMRKSAHLKTKSANWFANYE